MRPISVDMPVAVTRISPRPRVTVVFMKTEQCRSPRGTPGAWGEVSFATGWLSPVRAASSTSRPVAAITRPSAGIRSPASTSTTSPGTIASVGTLASVPSRRTRAERASMRRRAAREASARFSWTKPMTALTSTTTMTTAGVLISPATRKLTAAAPMRIRVRKFVNWAAKRRHAGTGGDSWMRFGPCSDRREATSAEVRPDGDDARIPRASPTDRVPASADLAGSGARVGLMGSFGSLCATAEGLSQPCRAPRAGFRGTVLTARGRGDTPLRMP